MSDVQPLPVAEALDYAISHCEGNDDVRAAATLRLLVEVWGTQEMIVNNTADGARAYYALLVAEETGDE